MRFRWLSCVLGGYRALSVAIVRSRWLSVTLGESYALGNPRALSRSLKLLKISVEPYRSSNENPSPGELKRVLTLALLNVAVLDVSKFKKVFSCLQKLETRSCNKVLRLNRPSNVIQRAGDF